MGSSFAALLVGKQFSKTRTLSYWLCIIDEILVSIVVKTELVRLIGLGTGFD